MKNEDFYFVNCGMSETGCIALGDLGANGYVAAIFARKRKNVSRLVFATELSIELLDLSASRDENSHIALNACQFLRTRGKAGQRLPAHSYQGSLDDDHVSQKRIGRAIWPSRYDSTKFTVEGAVPAAQGSPARRAASPTSSAGCVCAHHRRG
jgi:hypothetical protein